MTYDARAWITWISVAAVIVIVARHPLYAITMMIVALIIMAAFRRSGQEDQNLSITRLAVVILIFSAIYNALFVHLGETVLITLPDWPLIGGAVTVEALVEGATNGLTLVALLVVFMTLNAIVPVADLVRLIPSALHDLGLIILIALTYIPETRRHLRKIQEAQAIRGHELKGIRDWRPLVIPLLVGGLERAMRLAETMVSRGYGSAQNSQSSIAERLGLVLGLILSVAGWLLVVWQGNVGWLMLLVGLATLVGLVWRRGQIKRRTSYSPRTMGRRDWLILITSILALVSLLLVNSNDKTRSLTYSPYPQIRFPEFDWRFGLVLAFMVLPAILLFLEGQPSGEQDIVSG